MNIDEFVIDKIYSLMQQRGWSQQELAKQAKINYENLNRLLKGGRSITKSDVLVDIAKAFNISLEDLKSVDKVIPTQAAPSDRASLILEIQARLSKLGMDELQHVSDSLDQIERLTLAKTAKNQ